MPATEEIEAIAAVGYDALRKLEEAVRAVQRATQIPGLEPEQKRQLEEKLGPLEAEIAKLRGLKLNFEASRNHRILSEPQPHPLLQFLELHGTIVGEHVDCETLGRFAIASRFTLALNRTGSLRARWQTAAERLDATFERCEEIEYGDLSNMRRIADQTGFDPRVLCARHAIRTMSIPESDWPEAADAAWSEEDPMLRVSLMVQWQTEVCAAVRDMPMEFVRGFGLHQRDARFAGYYDFTGFPETDSGFIQPNPERLSHAMVLVLSFAYKTCCSISRCGECGYTHANDVHVNGWMGSNWGDSSRRDFFWQILEDRGGCRTSADAPIVSMEALEDFCDMWNSDAKVLDLEELLGARATRNLIICRGTEDIGDKRTQALLDATMFNKPFAGT